MKNFKKNISYLKSNPFQIFKIDNFLEKEFFDQINEHFPKIDNSKLSLKDNFGKYTLNPKDYNFENQLGTWTLDSKSGRDYAGPERILSQFYTLQKSIELKKEYEEENNFKYYADRILQETAT